MKKVLVTGAGGLVGHAAMEELQKHQEYEVFAAFHRRIDSQNNGINVLIIDLENTKIESLGIAFDCIVHCAAQIPSYTHSEAETAYKNRRIDDHIISYCAGTGCRLIYISSGTISNVGNNSSLMIEQAVINTRGMAYLKEKRNSEIEIENSCPSYCILRIPSPYGKTQRNMNVLKKWVEDAIAGEDIYYFGMGGRTQDFIDARDIACAIQKCIESKGNGLFHIASGKSISMKQLAGLITEIAREKFGSPSKAYACDQIDSQENLRISYDISLAEQELGWQPQIELEDGIRHWMQDRKEKRQTEGMGANGQTEQKKD